MRYLLIVLILGLTACFDGAGASTGDRAEQLYPVWNSPDKYGVMCYRSEIGSWPISCVQVVKP